VERWDTCPGIAGTVEIKVNKLIEEMDSVAEVVVSSVIAGD
jgi:hypothetical protein